MAKKHFAGWVTLLLAMFVGATAAYSSHRSGLDEPPVALSCLTRAALDEARRTGSIDSVLPACRGELLAVLGDDFGAVNEPTLRALLATVVAGNFAEHGVSSSIEYADIVRDAHLNCGNTIFLVGYLYGGLSSTALKPVGFDGGAVGNHAQLLFSSAGKHWILDPSVGLIAQTSFNALLRGEPVPASKIRIFSIRAKTLGGFRKTVYRAVLKGRYLPSDFMYLHDSLAEQKRGGGLSAYYTPGGLHARTRVRLN